MNPYPFTFAYLTISCFTFLLVTPWTMLLDALLLLLVGPGLESPVTVTMTSLAVSSLIEFRASMERCLTSLLAASIVVRGLLSDSAGDNRRVERGGLPGPGVE